MRLDNGFHETDQLPALDFRPKNAAHSKAAYDSNHGSARLVATRGLRFWEVAMRLLAVVLALCVLSGSAAGQSRSGAYSCVEKASGGIKYDERLKQWGSVTFPDEKFVLRLQHVGPRKINDVVVEDMQDYYVSLTRSGESSGQACLRPGAAPGSAVGVWDDGKMERCIVGIYDDYTFDVDGGRYLKTHILGYADGVASVSGGVCTKVN